MRSGRDIYVNGEASPSHVLFDHIRDLSFPPPLRHDVPLRAGEMLLFRSQDAQLRQLTFQLNYKPYDSLFAVLELPAIVATIQFAATNHRVFFISRDKILDFPLNEIACITTDSNTFVIRIKPQRCYLIDFKSESPLKYEIWTRRVVADYWHGQKKKEIIEYQPQIVFRQKKAAKKIAPLTIKPRVMQPETFFQKIIYHFLRLMLVLLFRIFIRTRVFGKNYMPAQGACVVVLNHEGYWDAHLAQCLLPRRIAFFAKNTEFAKKILHPLFKLIHAIPVRRHEIDPTCVRNALNWLARGQAVGIFIEGERCWSGRFASPKRGAIKLLLKANVPIVPVRIKGSFELLPRWGEKMQLCPVSLHIGEPFTFNADHRTIEKASQEVTRRLLILGEAQHGS